MSAVVKHETYTHPATDVKLVVEPGYMFLTDSADDNSINITNTEINGLVAMLRRYDSTTT